MIRSRPLAGSSAIPAELAQGRVGRGDRPVISFGCRIDGNETLRVTNQAPSPARMYTTSLGTMRCRSASQAAVVHTGLQIRQHSIFRKSEDQYLTARAGLLVKAISEESPLRSKGLHDLKANPLTIRMQVFSEQLIALLIFIATYILLATGYRERTIAAMAGVGAIYAFGILTPQEMTTYVDMNAIGLLFGMMVIVGALREARFFRWLGVYIANACRCRPVHLLVVFTLMTAALSALLDNVTTVLFMVTVTIDIAELAKLDPKPYILSEIVASNIGGAATLIGDPPNIMIATATGFSFTEFLVNMGPISLVALSISLLYFLRKFRKNMKPAGAEAGQQYSALPVMPSDVSPDPRLAWTGLATLFGAVVFFSLQDILGIYPTVVALAAAVVLLFVGGPKMPEILNDVEWSTLIFFGSLFIVVGALEKTGWMSLVTQEMSLFVGEDPRLGVSAVLWISSLTSAFIDNIPFTAAFIPVLSDLGTRSGANVYPLWWALSAGTGLGGNGTIIGASANVIATGLAQARGVKITFVEFVKVGMIVLLLTTALANLILIARF